MTDIILIPPVPAPHTSEEKRDELRTKIEARERRIAERTLSNQAQDAAGAATNYVKQNPLTVLGGAIAIGLIIGAMTKPGRRAAKGAATGAVSAVSGAATGASNAAKGASTKGVSRLGALLADALVAYGVKLIDEALDGARPGQDIGVSATAKARELRREAGFVVGSTAGKSRDMTRRTGRRATQAMRGLKDRITK